VTAYFFDSSALVKRYIDEIGSAWIQGIAATDTGNQLIIARITWVEVLSAFARRQREGSLTPTEVNDLIQIFRSDLNSQYQVIDIDRVLVDFAGQLVNQYPLRAYDAVQLASVLPIQSALAGATATSLVFLTADDRLLTIATTEGLLTDNPNNYP
jgi:predicted nucleic acid-binding protein